MSTPRMEVISRMLSELCQEMSVALVAKKTGYSKKRIYDALKAFPVLVYQPRLNFETASELYDYLAARRDWTTTELAADRNCTRQQVNQARQVTDLPRRWRMVNEACPRPSKEVVQEWRGRQKRPKYPKKKKEGMIYINFQLTPEEHLQMRKACTLHRCTPSDLFVRYLTIDGYSK